MALPKVGRVAPAFSLLNQDGEAVSLKEFRGEKNVLVYFYPKALTPGCTTQACGLRDSKSKLTRQKLIVLGLSPDPVKKLKKFQEKEKLNFDLLADEEHKIADKYGVWGLKKFMGREYMGVNRMSFLIGMDGKIKHVMDKVRTKTHHDEILDLVKELNK
jgi:peroxiredoxin Q/BCP